ncbi:MAG: ABC1 kinase family protein, partial [Alphaproteobacteria bacterium]
QVHYAVGKDSRELACKLQYPDMKSTVEADLKQLKLIFQIYRRFDSAVDTGEIYEEISERLREELDYLREARHMALYSHMLKDEPSVHVPQTVPELTTKRLLTMDWLHGRKLLEFKDHDPEHRNEVARNMFRAWYVPFYGFGIIHGDPHLGNYSVREDFTINLLDFGCIRVFPPRFVQSVIDLYYALRDNDEALAVAAYETWGFKDISRELIEVLNIWARFVYAPLMEDRVRPIEETNATAYGAETAAKVHSELKRLGGVTPPREFVLMDRATIGLGSVFLHLKAEINWCQLFHELVDGLDVQAIGERQASALNQAGLA